MFSKHKFFVLKRKWILIALCLIFIIASVVVYFSAIRPTFQPKPLRTIVIDAGHGGIDNGTYGKITGVKESQLNLLYANSLKKMFEELDFKVVMTRKDENGLYSVTAANKKRSDMQKRKSIIDKSGAAIVLSVHMNSFSLPSCQGAQVFYASGNDSGKRLAQKVQNSLSQSFSNARKNAEVGDYYILNCTDKPSILVEFGFLSNPQEEKLLQDKDYMQKMCYSVLSGILEYFDM